MKYNKHREIARRVRQRNKMLEKRKIMEVMWTGNLVLSNRYLDGVLVK